MHQRQLPVAPADRAGFAALPLAAPAVTQLVFADPGDEPITPTSPRIGDELRMSTGPASESQYVPRHAQSGVTQFGLDQHALCEWHMTVSIRTVAVNRTQFERSRSAPIKALGTCKREV